jgi:hypothetical protein
MTVTPATLFLVWWSGGTACALLAMIAQGKPRQVGWTGVIIAALLWPVTPFAMAYIKKHDPP